MLTIIVVNWNAGRHQLRRCIDSIIQHGASLVCETIVIDNGSTDSSEKSIEGLSHVTLIRAGVNLGFAKACNLGAQRAQHSEYLLFLNPDAALHPDTLPKVLAYMQHPANVKVGICGVQLIDKAGHIARSCSRFPSAGHFVVHAVGLDRLFLRFGHFMAEWDHAQTRQVDHVIGAFFLMRREVFDALHGFDERFFVYLEDVDFSFRARQIGWNSVYLADAQAFHAGGGTSNQVKAKRLFYSLRSRLQYAFKHFSRIDAVAVLLTTLLVEPISRSFFALLNNNWPSLKETYAAYRMLIAWQLQKIIKKTRLMQDE